MTNRTSLSVAALLGVTASFGLVSSAMAGSFERNRNISVSERPKPEYQTNGIDLGGFILRPELVTGLKYSDNIFALRTNPVDDVIFKFNPSAVIQSKWSVHSLAFHASVDHNEYLDLSSESYTDLTFGSDARLDAGQGIGFGFGAQYQALNEPRTSSSSPANTTKPIEYDLVSLYANASREVNRIRVKAAIGLRDYDYKDGALVGGGVADQDDRDRAVLDLSGRVGYAVSPDTSVFVEVGYNDRYYDLQPPATPLNRDSDGYQVLVGANFDLSALVRGEIAIGYLDQRFEDPTLSGVSGFAVRANVDWFVTPLTTVGIGGNRSVEDSGIPGSSGYLSSSAYFKVDHELLRNLIISGELTYGYDDYEGVDRQDERVGGTISSTILLQRGLGLSLYYTYANQTSGGINSGTNYNNSQVGFNLKLQR